MSERAAKRQPIDLEEFDRQLRAPAADRDPHNAEDPLAELARLVSAAPDPFAPIFAAGGSKLNRPQPQRQPVPLQPVAVEAHPEPAQGLRPGFEAADESGRSDEAGRSDETWAADETWTGDEPFEESAPGDQSRRLTQRDLAAALRPRQRSRGSILLMGGALGLVIGGLAGTLALRSHMVRFGGTPTILADSRPYKVKPPAQAPKDQIENATTLLDKARANVIRPARVVNTEEQPIDLSVATADRQGAGAAAGSGSIFPAPKRVKTVLVRPDGTIISDEDSAAAPVGQPASGDGATSVSSEHPAPQPSRASVPAPERGASFANVVEQATNASAAPAPATSAPEHAPAAASTHAVPPATTEASAANPRAKPHREPTRRLAEADPTSGQQALYRGGNPQANSTTAAAEGWAVQLAAPGSERLARSEAARLERRFSSQLGGRTLVYHQAQSNGRTVWRVRTAGLSREEASSLCGRIKRGGGACFIARN